MTNNHDQPTVTEAAQAIADTLYPAGGKAANSRNFIAYSAALAALTQRGQLDIKPSALGEQVRKIALPDDPHTDAWQLGFCRARKMAADLIDEMTPKIAFAYKGALIEAEAELARHRSQETARAADVGLRAHFTRMMEAAANYIEPTTYIARHPNTDVLGPCRFNTEFLEPDENHSDSAKADIRHRRDQAFIRDMIYMLDGPEQRAALTTPPADDGPIALTDTDAALIEGLRKDAFCDAPGPTGRKCGKCFRCKRRRAADRIEALLKVAPADDGGLREALGDVAIWKREAADRSEKLVELNLDRAAMGVENMQLREVLEVGERFLNACNSAWAAGEPSHRVQTMLDSADEFRAAIDALPARQALSGGEVG